MSYGSCEKIIKHLKEDIEYLDDVLYQLSCDTPQNLFEIHCMCQKKTALEKALEIIESGVNEGAPQFKVSVSEFTDMGMPDRKYNLGPFKTLNEAQKARDDYNKKYMPFGHGKVKVSYKKIIIKTDWMNLS